MEELGLSNEDILKTLRTGEDYTDYKGEHIVWSSKTKLALALDDDGNIKTV